MGAYQEEIARTQKGVEEPSQLLKGLAVAVEDYVLDGLERTHTNRKADLMALLRQTKTKIDGWAARQTEEFGKSQAQIQGIVKDFKSCTGCFLFTCGEFFYTDITCRMTHDLFHGDRPRFVGRLI